MNYVHVTNGLVDDSSVWDEAMPEDWDDFANWYEEDTAQIGWSYANGVFSAPVSPPPPVIDLVAQDLADIQAQLAAVGTFDRALFVLVLQQLNVLRAGITALNGKTGLTGNAMPQIPLATAVTAMQAAMRGNLPS